MEEEKQEKTWCEQITKQVEEKLENIGNTGVTTSNVDYLYKLIDIHKDLSNENYWKEKIDMMYRNYGEYNEGSYGRRGVPGSGRGRYREGGYSAGGNYGRRGVDSKYRGEEMMDKMYEEYQEYSEGSYNYGADQQTLQSLEKMLESVKKFMKHLEKEAKSREEVEMIKEAAKEISEM